MPYTNMPKDSKTQGEMERCVKSVTAKGKPKKNAIAICYASVMGKGGAKKKDGDELEFVLEPVSLDPALLVEGMDVEEVDEVPQDFKTWVKEQFDGVRALLKAEPPAEKKKCPKCKAEVAAGKDGKCPECGADMEEILTEKKDVSPAPAEGAMFYKDAATGAYRWLAVFTNKFRDRDNPPEIIASEAHKDFVRAVNAGEWPMPEYRLWHIAAPIGRADFLTWHDAGFVVASGTIKKGLEPLVDIMQAAPYRWGNSHGMPVTEIRRDDPTDPTIIMRYRSKEITALPDWAAANALTLNLTTEEDAMGFSDKDRERLRQMFPDKADEVEKLLTEFGAKAEQVVDNKEVTPPAAEPAPAPDLSAYPTRDEVAEAMKPMVETLQAMTKSLDELTSRLADAETKAKARDEEALRLTPAASLAEMLAGSIVKSKPVETKVKGRAKDEATGPKQTRDDVPLTGALKIPMIRDLVFPPETD